MSDTNQVQLNYVPEVTPGVTPTNPVFRRFRFTGAPDLAAAPLTVVSNEIVPGRQIQDVIPVGVEAGGNVDIELTFYDHDELMEGAFYNSWTKQNNRTKLENNLAASGTQFTFNSGTAFKANDIIFAKGFAIAGNNGTHVLSGGNATTASASGLTAEASPPTDASIHVIGFSGAASEFALTTTGFANLTAASFNFTSGGQFRVGQWVYVSGFSTALANGWYRISAIASGQLTFDAADHTPAADAGTGDQVNLFFGDFIVNGAVEKSFTLEERFTDHSPETIQLFTGMHVTQLVITAEPQAIVTAQYQFQGFNGSLDDAGRISGATDLDPLQSTPLNSSSNVGIIRQAGAEVTGPNFVLGLTLNINNNLRFQNAIGSLGAVGVGAGEFSVTGTLNTYFGNKTLANNVINGTETSVDFRFEDLDGSVLLFDIPRLKFTSGAPTVTGKNEDTQVDLEYQALARKIDQTYTLMACRFWRTALDA